MNDFLLSLFSYFCVLSLGAISIIFTERAGIINLGVNGTMVIGATFYMIFAYLIAPATKGEANEWLNILLYIFAALGGILFMLLHGLISIKWKGNQTISGIAMNILAPAITLILLYKFGKSNAMDYKVPLLELGNSKDGDLSSFVSLKMFVTITIIIVSFISLTFTKWGLRFRSVGENPQAADAAGINVNKIKWISILISGAIAGIAGAIYISEFSSGGRFRTQVNVEGLGFLAIAIVIISRWKTIFAGISSLIFAALFAMGQHANNLFDNGKEIQPILMMLPYLFTLIVMILFSKPSLTMFSKLFFKISSAILKPNLNPKGFGMKFSNSMNWVSNKLLMMSNNANGPKAVGEPYDKSKR